MYTIDFPQETDERTGHGSEPAARSGLHRAVFCYMWTSSLKRTSTCLKMNSSDRKNNEFCSTELIDSLTCSDLSILYFFLSYKSVRRLRDMYFSPQRDTVPPSAAMQLTHKNSTTQARFPFKHNRLHCVRCVNENRKKRKRAFLFAGACVCCVKISSNKRKRQPIGMLGRSSGKHDWLLANASDCVWMETGLQSQSSMAGERPVQQ